MTTTISYEGYIPPEILAKEWESLQLKIDEELRPFIGFCVKNGVKTVESCQGGWHTIRLWGRIGITHDAAVIFDTDPNPRVKKLIRMAKLDPQTFDVYRVRYGGIKVCWPSDQTNDVIPQLMQWLQI